MENKKSTIITNEGKEVYVIDSREVAEIMGKTHKEVMQYLEGSNYKSGRVKMTGIISILENMGVDTADYFIESTYDDKGKTNKCYLITKNGGELLASKIQGVRGLVFNRLLNDRFKDMECDDTKNDD